MLPFLLLLLTPFVCGIPFDDGLEPRDARAAPSYRKIEGDMMMTSEQVEAIERGEDPTKVGEQARGLQRYRKWPGGVVPYTLHSSVKNKWINWLGIKGPTEKAILSAIKEWQQKTCIRFKPRTNEKDYVEFFAGDGCWSYVGRLGRGKQQISIGRGCRTHGIAAHEIGHALGFFHEQSRPDRDNYVEIVWNNIQSAQKSNFQKYGHGTIDSLNVPYDYGSIMHYGKSSFAVRSGLTTIRVKNPGASIGQRKHLSDLDVKQMNLFYKCN